MSCRYSAGVSKSARKGKVMPNTDKIDQLFDAEFNGLDEEARRAFRRGYEIAAQVQVGSWAWAFEQMKAGKTVTHGDINLREQFPGGGYYLATRAAGLWFWHPISEDFEATDWRVIESE